MKNDIQNKFSLQDELYEFPYHHLASREHRSIHHALWWGLEYLAYLEIILAFLRKISFSSLADVGCGDGKLILEIMKQARKDTKDMEEKKVVGVDTSARAILFARAFNFGNGASFSDQPFETMSEKFDAVTLIEVMEHVSDEAMEDFVSSLRERLNAGGHLVVSVPTVNIPLQKKHYRHYDLPLLQKHLPGFALVEHRFSVQAGLRRSIFLGALGKAIMITPLRKIWFRLAEKFLFPATAWNGRHLVALFKKI